MASYIEVNHNMPSRFLKVYVIFLPLNSVIQIPLSSIYSTLHTIW
jgi:hypothetical protein